MTLSYLNKKRVEQENITFSFDLIIPNPEAKEYNEFSLRLVSQVRSSKGLGNASSAQRTPHELISVIHLIP